MAASSPAKRAPRKASAVRAAPKPPVVLDLDSLSKAQAFPDLQIPAGPFTFLLDSVTYELSDPRDSDWKMALQLSQNPFLLMRTALVGADDPVDNPTGEELEACRERLGLPAKPPPAGTEQAAEEAELWPDGIVPALIDRFTCAHLPTWKLDALFGRWHEHYQIELQDGKGILAALLGR
jgi:hypothetical protein